MPVERADRSVYFRLPKLIQIPQELEDVSSAASRERERRFVVLEVLAEGVPVSPLLVLISAARGGGRGRGGDLAC